MNIAVCGNKGSGTEEIVKWFNTNTTFTYKRDIRWYAAAKVLSKMAEKGIDYKSIDDCYSDYEDNISTWNSVISDILSNDYTTLCKICLGESSIVHGIKGKDEIVVCKSEGLLDLVIWIEKDVPVDSNQLFGPELCDIVIPNNQDTYALISKLKRLSLCLGVFNGKEE